MAFTERTSKPGAGNKYYIRKASGGYSNAIAGYPRDKDCDVLSNCVGYAYGRFNEIGGYGYCKYLAPVNAENFIQYKGSCKMGQSPRPGACMVWQKGKTLAGSDGAGHVAIVERVISENEVYTSESGYGTRAFWNQTRKKGNDGNWGASADYKFLGFIYNPAVSEVGTPTADNAANSAAIKAGDRVRIVPGAVYYNMTVNIPDWMLSKEWIVKSVNGERAVIDKSTDGKNSVCSPISVKYLRILKKETGAYRVKVTVSALNIRKGAGTDYPIVGCIRDRGVYTITEEKNGAGASKWGKLKSGIGWIALDYVEKI